MTTIAGKPRAARRRNSSTKLKRPPPKASRSTVQQQLPPLPPASLAQSAAPATSTKPRFTEPGAASLLELRARPEDDTLDEIFQKHLADFRVAFSEMLKQPPSVVFFGGARLKPEDKYYKLAQAFGRALAGTGIPPKTGAGPGAMHAVPAEFVEARDEIARAQEEHAGQAERIVQSVIDGVSRLADLADQRTLGFNIKLPAEQKVSPAIEDASEIQLFAYRKFALYENVRGVVVFPGGFGTLDELMEVLILKRNGKTRDPIVLAGKDYWEPILDAWRASARRHGRDLMADLLDDVLVTDDPGEGIRFIERHKTSAFDSAPDELYTRMVREIKLARYVATRQPTAITVLGGDGVDKSDPSLHVIDDVAGRVKKRGAPLRVGADGQVARLVEEAAGKRHVQKVLWGEPPAQQQEKLQQAQLQREKRARGAGAKGGASAGGGGGDVVTFAERIPHKETLLRNSAAYVVLPCAERGKDELTSVLCQIQTGKLPQRPLVLVDSAYWKPIVEAWGRQMLGPQHEYIEPDDLALVTYADSADDVMRALDGVLD